MRAELGKPSCAAVERSVARPSLNKKPVRARVLEGLAGFSLIQHSQLAANVDDVDNGVPSTMDLARAYGVYSAIFGIAGKPSALRKYT